MKKVILFVFMITVFTQPVWAQDDGLLLIDEFGKTGDDERLARLDNSLYSFVIIPIAQALSWFSAGRIILHPALIGSAPCTRRLC